jgi:nicotinate-nucleotide adenylyltransferase
MGQDNINNINTWKNYNDIINNHIIYVFPRNNPNNSTLHINSPNIILTSTPIIDISSSLIRKLIQNNIDVSYMLHPNVYKYIQEINNTNIHF